MATNVATRKTAKKTNVKKAAAKPATKTAAKTSAASRSKATSKAIEPVKSKGKAKATKAKPAANKVRTETVKSWYDYPQLYELGFLKETPKESKFCEAVFKKYVPFPVKRVLELGCGSGRLVCDMATRGFAMTGLDLNPTALEYCKKKLKKLGVKGEAVVGDMTKFEFDEPFDAAINSINTFRHLESEEAALAHLDCVAEHLKPGGVFILSLHLLPVDGDLWGTERWAAKEDDLSVYYALTVVETSMKTRLEKLRISMLVKNNKESFRLSDHITLRIYTAPQLKSLIAKSKKLKLIAVHDFWYDIESTQKLNGEAVDSILILQRV
ncbi:MAG: methyltransferase domain-containing protein [Planctomycetota bacterium]|nr:methyltransferase domain-containing protein [Planctomycetota bacterium]